jgi:hypothetical protein
LATRLDSKKKKKGMLLFSLITLLVILAGVSSSSLTSIQDVTQPGRLYLWSWGGNSPSFSSQDITKSLVVDKAVGHVADLLNGYEVVVLLTPEVGASRSGFPLVQQSIQHAPSTQILHNVYPSEQYNSLAESLSETLAHSSSNQQSAIQHKSLNEIEELLKKNSHILHDGKADVFVAPVSSKSDVVEFSLTSRILLEKSQKVLFVSYDEIMAVPRMDSSRALSEGGYSRMLAVSSNLDDGVNYKPEGGEYSIYYQSQYLYITPDIFTGLMTFLFVAFTLGVGLSCLGSIQGMSSFYDKLPTVGKEA